MTIHSSDTSSSAQELREQTMPGIRHFAFAGATAAAAVLAPGVAGATAASGVSALETSRTTLPGGRERVVQEITIQPGGSTGWQWHDGTLFVSVKQGTVTHNEAGCFSTDVYSENSLFVEQAGPDNVQIDRNLGTTPLVLQVLYVNPAGRPLAEDAPNPGCRFQ
jgi:hypothetical protein